MVGETWTKEQAGYWRDQIRGGDWLSRRARSYLDWVIEGDINLVDFRPLYQVFFSVWMVRLVLSLLLKLVRGTK